MREMIVRHKMCEGTKKNVTSRKSPRDQDPTLNVEYARYAVLEIWYKTPNPNDEAVKPLASVKKKSIEYSPTGSSQSNYYEKIPRIPEHQLEKKSVLQSLFI